MGKNAPKREEERLTLLSCTTICKIAYVCHYYNSKGVFRGLQHSYIDRDASVVEEGLMCKLIIKYVCTWGYSFQPENRIL